MPQLPFNIPIVTLVIPHLRILAFDLESEVNKEVPRLSLS